MQYFISKKNYHGDVVFVNYDHVGYQVSPKEELFYDGIKVDSIVIVKPDFINKVIKRKIKYHLDQYLNFIINRIDGDEDPGNTRRALDDLARYRVNVKERYSLFLDDKYLELLEKKFDILERELKSNLVYSKSLEEKETKRSR